MLIAKLATLLLKRMCGAACCRWYEPARRQPVERAEGLKVWDQFVVPLQHCPRNCSNRGMCLAREPDSTAGACKCFKVGAVVLRGQSCLQRALSAEAHLGRP